MSVYSAVSRAGGDLVLGRRGELRHGQDSQFVFNCVLELSQKLGSFSLWACSEYFWGKYLNTLAKFS